MHLRTKIKLVKEMLHLQTTNLWYPIEKRIKEFKKKRFDCFFALNQFILITIFFLYSRLSWLFFQLRFSNAWLVVNWKSHPSKLRDASSLFARFEYERLHASFRMPAFFGNTLRVWHKRLGVLPIPITNERISHWIGNVSSSCVTFPWKVSFS